MLGCICSVHNISSARTSASGGQIYCTYCKRTRGCWWERGKIKDPLVQFES